MNKKISFGMAITIALVAATLTFSITMILAMRMFDNTIASINEKEVMFSNLTEINAYVTSNDYYDFSYDTVYDTLGSGFVLGLGDKYAKYYTAKAYTEYQDTLSGKLMGIGVKIAKDASSGYAKIVRVYDASPAADANMAVGGYITAITDAEGNTVEVKSLNDADAINAKLRGEDGTTVTVSYLDNNGINSAITLTRSSYTTQTVYYQMVGNSCGYIKIDTFDINSPAQLNTALDALTAQGAKSLVFDLRDNPGGSAVRAYACADRVTEAGVLAVSEDKSGNQTVLYTGDDQTVEQPIVCLVNGNTAGYAELFASCVQMKANGKLVGVQTAGKGVIQSDPQRMSNGSAVVVTIGKLLTPNAKEELYSFDGTGLAMDVEATMSAEEQQSYYDLTVDTDSQIQRAVSTANGMAGISTSAAGTTSAG